MGSGKREDRAFKEKKKLSNSPSKIRIGGEVGEVGASYVDGLVHGKGEREKAKLRGVIQG